MGLPKGREPYGDGASIVVSGRESRLHGHRGVKGAQGRSEAGFPWTGRQGTRDANRQNVPAHYPKLRQTAKVKETRKPESRMMRQVSCPVRRGAGRKGRKDLARSLPNCHARQRDCCLGFSRFLYFQQRHMRGTVFRHWGVGQQYLMTQGSPPRMKMESYFQENRP